MKNNTIIFCLFFYCSMFVHAQNVSVNQLLKSESRTDEEKKSDEAFINETISLYGSRDKAFTTFIDVAWKEIVENKLNESADDFIKAWLLNPEHPDSYMGMYMVMNVRKSSQDADDLFKKGIMLDKDKSGQKKFYSRALDFAGRKKDTLLLISFLIKSLAIDSASLQTYQKIAYYCTVKKMYNEAINAYNGAIRLRPADSSLFFNRGIIYKKCKKNKEAIADFTSAVNISKFTYYDAILNRGMLHYEEGDFNASIADYNRCIDLNSKDPLPYRFLGISRIMIYDQKGACEAWKKAKKLGDTPAEELYNAQCK